VQVVTAFHLKLKGGKIMKQTSSQPRLDGKIPGRIKYTFALGALGKDMIYGMIATFSMIYFTDIIKVNPVFIGVMFFVAKLWDAFNDLFMGMIVDNTRSRWGKFIPWLVIGTLVNSIVFVVLFTDFHLDGVGLCVFATAAYILWGMTYTIMDIPYWSIIPNLTSNPEEREKVSVLPRILQVSDSHLLLQALVFKLLRLSAAAQQIRQVITDLQS
jgi:melibiose permease